MNIFHLDKDPLLSALYHCDKHVVKMILESAQMLCTAHHHYGLKNDLYKPAYPHHPMTIWVGDSGANFYFTMKLIDCLTKKKYNKVHKTSKIILLLNFGRFFRYSHSNQAFSQPPQCMPDEYKVKCCCTKLQKLLYW